MASSPEIRDLIVLVADKNIEFTIKGLLSRPPALAIREITSYVVPHPERDPGCLLRAPEFLRPETAIVMLSCFSTERGRAATAKAGRAWKKTWRSVSLLTGKAGLLRSCWIPSWRSGCGAIRLTWKQSSGGMAGIPASGPG